MRLVVGGLIEVCILNVLNKCNPHKRQEKHHLTGTNLIVYNPMRGRVAPKEYINAVAASIDSHSRNALTAYRKLEQQQPPLCVFNEFLQRT